MKPGYNCRPYPGETLFFRKEKSWCLSVFVVNPFAFRFAPQIYFATKAPGHQDNASHFVSLTSGPFANCAGSSSGTKSSPPTLTRAANCSKNLL
jgi:hypothetical protein